MKGEADGSRSIVLTLRCLACQVCLGIFKLVHNLDLEGFSKPTLAWMPLMLTRVKEYVTP